MPADEFNYSGSELDALAQARNYYCWVLGKFEPSLGSTVIEVGAGIGTFSSFLLSLSQVRKLIAIEPAANTYPVLAERFGTNPRVETRYGYLKDHSKAIIGDSLVAVNVLEHIADDHEFLRDAFDCVSPGGSLLIFVPALPAIFGTLDEAFAHQRRYTKASLQRAIELSGWRVQRVSYMNFPGIAAWFLAGRILRKTSIAAADAKAYDRLVVPWLSRLESRFEPPIGANLVAIATKP